MSPGPDVETHHHPAHTGHRWLDIVLGLCAMVVSVVSLFVALHHGETMEKMVEASTWPNVDYSRSSADAEARPRADLILVNSGVGPARIESFEVFHGGRPVPSRTALLNAIGTPGRPVSVIGSFVADKVLPAGGTLVFLSATPNDTAGFSEFRSSLPDITARVCFCSVLEDCWIRDSRRPRPEKVKACPVPAIPYAG